MKEQAENCRAVNALEELCRELRSNSRIVNLQSSERFGRIQLEEL